MDENEPRPKGKYCQTGANGTGLRCFNGWSKQGAERWNEIMQAVHFDCSMNGADFDNRMLTFARTVKLIKIASKNEARAKEREGFVVACDCVVPSQMDTEEEENGTEHE